MTALAITLAFGLAAVCFLWVVDSVGAHDQIQRLKAENARLRADYATAVGHPSVRGRRLRVVDGGAR